MECIVLDMALSLFYVLSERKGFGERGLVLIIKKTESISATNYFYRILLSFLVDMKFLCCKVVYSY